MSIIRFRGNTRFFSTVCRLKDLANLSDGMWRFSDSNGKMPRPLVNKKDINEYLFDVDKTLKECNRDKLRDFSVLSKLASKINSVLNEIKVRSHNKNHSMEIENKTENKTEEDAVYLDSASNNIFDHLKVNDLNQINELKKDLIKSEKQNRKTSKLDFESFNLLVSIAEGYSSLCAINGVLMSHVSNSAYQLLTECEEVDFPILLLRVARLMVTHRTRHNDLIKFLLSVDFLERLNTRDRISIFVAVARLRPSYLIEPLKNLAESISIPLLNHSTSSSPFNANDIHSYILFSYGIFLFPVSILYGDFENTVLNVIRNLCSILSFHGVQKLLIGYTTSKYTDDGRENKIDVLDDSSREMYSINSKRNFYTLRLLMIIRNAIRYCHRDTVYIRLTDSERSLLTKYHRHFTIIEMEEDRVNTVNAITEKLSIILTKLKIAHHRGAIRGPFLLDILERDNKIVWHCNGLDQFYSSTFDKIASRRLEERILKAMGYKVANVDSWQWSKVRNKKSRIDMIRMTRYIALRDRREHGTGSEESGQYSDPTTFRAREAALDVHSFQYVGETFFRSEKTRRPWSYSVMQVRPFPTIVSL